MRLSVRPNAEKHHRLYDVIVVGSGASGGWACKRLAEAGLHVALLEAGKAQSDENFTEHKPPFELKYRDMAPEVVRRLVRSSPDSLAANTTPTGSSTTWMNRTLPLPTSLFFGWAACALPVGGPTFGAGSACATAIGISRRLLTTAMGKIGRSDIQISSRTTILSKDTSVFLEARRASIFFPTVDSSRRFRSPARRRSSASACVKSSAAWSCPRVSQI